MGMPRRVPVYDPQFQTLNVIASIGSFVLAASTLFFFYNVFWSLKKGPKAGSSPWGGRTLEWMIPSPPPYYNFKKIPAVTALPYNFTEPLPYFGGELERPSPSARFVGEGA
jgi:cytochrome c oxidase subunit 1